MDEIQSAEVIKVIRTRSKRGEGTEKDPVRIVTQYWDFEGHFLAEDDPIFQEKKETGVVR